jgi:hypothetical protein
MKLQTVLAFFAELDLLVWRARLSGSTSPSADA